MLKNKCNLVFVSRNGFDLIVYVFTLFDLSCRVIRDLCKYATFAILSLKTFPKL